jgi:hypothetical protein
MFDEAALVTVVRYVLSALLVGYLAIATVQARGRTWMVFLVGAAITTFAYGVLMSRLIGGDHPGYVVGAMMYFLMITIAGVLLGLPVLLWRGWRSSRSNRG